MHYAFLLQHISPSLFGAQDGIQLALIVLLGGAVPLLGPLVGSIVVLFVHELPFATNPNHVQIGYGMALVLLILLLPEGMVSGCEAVVCPHARRPAASDHSGACGAWAAAASTRAAG